MHNLEIDKRKIEDLKIAIIHDELNVWGGAEDVTKTLLEVFPKADLFTSVYDKKVKAQWFPESQIKTTFVQWLPFRKWLSKEFKILYPIGFKLLNLRKYDVVICNSTAFSKYINVEKHTKLILWINTPTPFLWMDDRRSMKDSKRFTYNFIYQKLLKAPIHKILKSLELKILKRADKVIAISKTVQDRITESYNVESVIINPPIHLENLKYNPDMQTRKKWFFYVGRIESYKGVELAIRAAIKAKVQFKFGGVGSQLEYLKKLIVELNGKGYVQYLGYPTQEEKYEYLYNCKALISPIKQEDFGMVPLEGNAAGAPVIAYRSGSAVEVLSENNPKTAIFFDEYNEDKLAEVLKKFDSKEFNAESCRKHAEGFSTEIFKYKFKKLVEDVL